MAFQNLVEDLNIDAEIIAKKHCFEYSFTCATNDARFFDNEHREDRPPPENTDLFQLLQTCGNQHLNKMILVFSSLIDELNELSGQTKKKFIGPLQLYREDYILATTIERDPDQRKLFIFDDDDEDDHFDDHRFDNRSALFGETDGENYFSAIAFLLANLFDLICFIKRCYEVATNLILQLHTFLLLSNIKTNDKSFRTSLKEVLPDLNEKIRFDIAWESLTNISISLINLDKLFSQQSSVFRRDILNYKRSLETVLCDSECYGLESKSLKIQKLLAVINEIEHELLEGCIALNSSSHRDRNLDRIDSMFFKGLIVSILNCDISENGAILRNNHLNESIINFIKNSCMCLEKNDEDLFNDEHRILSLSAFFALYVFMFWKESDRKMLKNLIEIQRKFNLLYVHLPGNVSVSPDVALLQILPRQLTDAKVFEYFSSQRSLLLKSGSCDQRIKQLTFAITQWITKAEESFVSGFKDSINNGDTLKQVFNRIKLIKEGILFSQQLHQTIRNCIAIHLENNQALSKIDTLGLCRAIILLKGLKRFFSDHKKLVLDIVASYQKYNACAMLNILTKVKRKILSKVTDYSEQKLDSLSALILIANCLNGPLITKQRIILISLCLSYVQSYPELFCDDDLEKIHISFTRICYFDAILPKLNEWFDCQFLHFNNEIVKVYFRNFYDSFGGRSPTTTTDINGLQYFFDAISDVIPFFRSIRNEAISENLIRISLENTLTMFTNQFMNPILKDFEDELRFLSHIDLKLGEKNPFNRNFKDFKSLLSSEPFKIFNGRATIWFKRFFERYLNKLAYNMTTIALHDWKTYESMLGYASDKFNLEFASLQLPTQTLEQGLDIVEITRNITSFIASYQYNLNNQFFIERDSSNKHLNVLTIKHFANSIQTHGFGIINSTVNFIYKFLRQKLQTLFQFLYEEHVKSRLIKDIRYFREMIQLDPLVNSDGEVSNGNNRSKTPQQSSSSTVLAKFPYERAEKFVKGIRKLGQTKDGHSYLDKFRELLTEIGNVMGFIRMLRSGSMHCTAQIADFVPDLDDLQSLSFEQLVRDERSIKDGDDCETMDAAKNLDLVLKTITENYSDSTDYFKLLVEVFATTFRDPKYVHLRNFYVILPATTLNFVEYICICKEQLQRKSMKEANIFTEDGFAMGVVFVLKILNQFNQFDSLQWFLSIDDHVQQSISKIDSSYPIESVRNSQVESKQQSSIRSSSSNKDLQKQLEQTKSLTLKRIQMFHREFQLLKFNLTSSRILYKSSI